MNDSPTNDKTPRGATRGAMRGYKMTEVGLIPEDWDVKKIQDIAPLQRGFDLPTSQLKHGKYPVVYSNGIQNFHNKATCSGPGVITGRSGTLGVIHYVEGDYWAHNTTLWVTDFKANYPKYIYYLYLFIGFERFGSGSGVPTLNRNDAHTFKIPLPPTLHEQRLIADALSDIDAQIAALDDLIAKQRDIKQGAMQRLLTGEERLPGFSGEWEKINIADHSLLKARIGWQGLTTAEYLKSGDYYLITGTDFEDGKIQWNTCHFVEENRYSQDPYIQLKPYDVLVTKDGTIGKIAYIEKLDKPATLNSGVFVIRPTTTAYNPQFLYYILMSKIFKAFLAKLQAGSTINHLYQKDFVDFEFFVPPTLEEQRAIAAVLSDMDAEISALEAERDKMRDVKQGMMQELLTGKTRLV